MVDVPDDFSGAETYFEWSATIVYRRESGEVYGYRRHTSRSHAVAEAMVRESANYPHTERVLQWRGVRVIATEWSDLPAAALDTGTPPALPPSP